MIDESEVRNIRMKLAYAILWAEEREKREGQPVEIEEKWRDEMANRMLFAEQVLFMLRKQGLDISGS